MFKLIKFSIITFNIFNYATNLITTHFIKYHLKSDYFIMKELISELNINKRKNLSCMIY